MRGNEQVIAHLNEALREELTAINQYFLHAEMAHNWGYHRFGDFIKKQSIDEMKHAEKLIERILFLDGLPNLQDLGKLYIGENLKEVIEADLRLELEGIDHYRGAIKAAEDAHDYVTRDLFTDILKDEERHQDNNRAELELIDKIGIENFGQSQI